MKIDLQNPPLAIKCIKSFYGFKEGSIFALDKNAALYEIIGKNIYNGALVHFELLEAINEGYFIEHEMTPNELYDYKLELHFNEKRYTSSEKEVFLDGIEFGKKNSKP
jgi:hypothetical protein